MSVFSKVIGRELSDGSIDDLYLRCWMNFSIDVLQTEAPQFVDLGLLDVKTLNDFSILGTTATRIRRLTDVFHWSALDHVFGEVTANRMILARSDQDYRYKTDFEIWRENQDFGRQNITMS